MIKKTAFLCLAAVVGLGIFHAVHAAPKGKTVDVRTFGAIGDGTTDDTAAIQKALDSLHAGETLVFPKGKVFRHTDVLTVGVAGAHLSGPGTLLATNEEKSCLRVNADNVVLDNGLTLRIAATSRRWDAYEQMKLRLSDHKGIVLRGITIDGSAAAGIYIGNCSDYLLENVTVLNTRADGIHNTAASHDGVIRRPVIRNVGDDGVAVVSYEDIKSPCRNITIESPRFYGNVWGRAFTVVGGDNITFRNVYAENSNAASIYVASEGKPWYTFASKNVRFLGGTIKNANRSKTVDHGAVLVYSGRAGYPNENVEIADLNIIDTRAEASRQVGVLGEASHVTLRNFSFVGGPKNLFSATAPPDSYNSLGWRARQDGGKDAPVAEHIGFPPASSR